jgi:hypothetical protein
MTDANWPDEAREALEYAMASHFSRNRQPHMSGDPRMRLSAMERRNFDDAMRTALETLAPFVSAYARDVRATALREAAGIARTHAAAAKRCSEESSVIYRIRAEYLATAFALNTAADDIEAAAILARVETQP